MQFKTGLFIGGTIVKFQLLLLPTISLLDMLQPTSGYILVRVVLAEFCCEICPFNLFKIAVIVVKDFNNFRLLSDKSRANLFWLMIMMQMKLLMLLNVSSLPQPSWQLLRYRLLCWQLCRQHRGGSFGWEGLLSQCFCLRGNGGGLPIFTHICI